MNPSSKLLSNILGRKVKEGINKIAIVNNLVVFAFEDEDMWSDINIYELAHMCKESAWNEYHCILSTQYKKGLYDNNKSLALLDTPWDPSNREFFEADTESEAVFEAYEWILKQKG